MDFLQLLNCDIMEFVLLSRGEGKYSSVIAEMKACIWMSVVHVCITNSDSLSALDILHFCEQLQPTHFNRCHIILLIHYWMAVSAAFNLMAQWCQPTEGSSRSFRLIHITHSVHMSCFVRPAHTLTAVMTGQDDRADKHELSRDICLTIWYITSQIIEWNGGNNPPKTVISLLDLVWLDWTRRKLPTNSLFPSYIG